MNGDWLLIFVAVLVRVSGIVMLLPGIGATYIPMRVKAVICILFSLVIVPIVADDLQKLISNRNTIIFMFLGEMIVGLVVGLSIRLIVYAASFAAGMISNLIGLTNVFGINVDHGESVSILETLLGLLTTALIFATDTHLLMIASIRKSYINYPVAQLINSQQALIVIVDVIRNSTLIAMHIAAPLLLFSAISNFAIALINRIIQQVPIYFVMSGMVVLCSLALLAKTFDKSVAQLLDALVAELLK